MQILISFIPLVIVLFFIFIFRIKVTNKIQYVINVTFLTIISILLLLLFQSLVRIVMPVSPLDLGVKSLIYELFGVALVEELTKFIPSILGKPNNKKLILNAILISTLFASIENFGYLGDGSGYVRILGLNHTLFSLIPVWFLIIGRKRNHKFSFTFVGFILAMFAHALYNMNCSIKFVLIIYAVIGYVLTIFSLYKASKMNEEVIAKKKNIVLNIILVVVVVYFIHISVKVFSTDNNYTKFNEYCDNKDTNLSIKVISSEDGEYTNVFGSTDHYIRVKMKIKNDTNEDIVSNDLDYKIENKYNHDDSSIPYSGFGDDIDLNLIPANEEVEGYIYFRVDGKPKDYLFKYIKWGEKTSEKDKCIFNLK